MIKTVKTFCCTKNIYTRWVKYTHYRALLLILRKAVLNISEKMKHRSHQSSTRDGTKRTSAGVLKQTKSFQHFALLFLNCDEARDFLRIQSNKHVIFKLITVMSSKQLSHEKSNALPNSIGVSSLASFQHGRDGRALSNVFALT